MDDYMEANRRLWEAWTPLHVKSKFYDVDGFKAVNDHHGHVAAALPFELPHDKRSPPGGAPPMDVAALVAAPAALKAASMSALAMPTTAITRTPAPRITHLFFIPDPSKAKCRCMPAATCPLRGGVAARDSGPGPAPGSGIGAVVESHRAT